MGSKKAAFSTDILELIFNNVALAGIGDVTGLVGSTVGGSLYIALQSNSDKETDDVSGTETSYSNYARVAVTRVAGSWAVADGAATNNAAVTFPTCGVTGDTLGSFTICKGGTRDVDDAIYWGNLYNILTIVTGQTPEFAIGDIDVTED